MTKYATVRRIALVIAVASLVIIVALLAKSISTRNRPHQHIEYRAEDLIFGICFSPDSKSVLAGDGRGKLRVIDVESGSLREFDVGNWPTNTWEFSAIAFSPNGKHVLSAGINDLHVWSWPEMEHERKFADEDRVGGAFFKGDDEIVFSSKAYFGTIQSHNLRTGAVKQLFNMKDVRTVQRPEHYSGLRMMVDFGDVLVAAVQWDLIFVDPKTGVDTRCVKWDDTMIMHLTRIGNERIVASATNRKVNIVSADDGQVVRTIEPEGGVAALAVPPDGKTISVASSRRLDGPVVLQSWDWRSGHLLTKSEVDRWPITCMCYSPCGRYLALGGVDGKITITRVNGRE